jgi:uncharacterized Zn finger protein (UPF0148 family)
MCGGTDYPLSMGGPAICPACDCGVAPEATKARRELRDAQRRIEEMEQEIARLTSPNARGELPPPSTKKATI